MLLKYKIIICLVVLISIFFLGRFSVKEKIVTETKTIKVTDFEEVARLVKEELKKISSQKKQVKTIDKIKLPDGTVKTHETIATESKREETGSTANFVSVDTTTRTMEKTELKTPRNDFALEMQAGIENSFTNFSDLPKTFEFSPNVSAKLNYRVTGDLWAFARIKHEIFNNNNFYEIGISHKLEF